MLEETAKSAQPDLSHLATNEDLRVAKADIREEVADLRAEVRSMETRILRELRTQMLWFFTMLVGLLGLTVALLKFLP